MLEILKSCVAGDCAGACRRMKALHDTGYSANDIVGTVFRVSQRPMNGVAREAFRLEVGEVQTMDCSCKGSPLEIFFSEMALAA